MGARLSMKIIISSRDGDLELTNEMPNTEGIEVTIGSTFIRVSRHELMAALIAFDALHSRCTNEE